MINLGKTVVLRTVFPVALSIFAVIWTPSARVISNDIFLVIMMAMITAVVFSAMVIFTAVVFSFNRWSSFKCIVHMLSVVERWIRSEKMVERWTPSVRI